MTHFKVISDASEIKLSNKWTDATNCTSNGKIVGENGKPVNSEYKGRKYQIISKERPFSTSERIKRGFLGTIAVVFSLTLALLLKPIRNLFTLKNKKVLYGVSIPSTNNQSASPTTDPKKR